MKRNYGLSFNKNIDTSSGGYSAMVFGEDGNAVTVAGDRFGDCTVDTDNAAVITYTEGGTNIGQFYCGKLRLLESGATTLDRPFVRVLYAAKLPENASAGFFIRNDKMGEVITLEERLADTSGAYILTKTAEMPEDMTARFAGQGAYGSTQHNTLYTDLAEKGGEIRIKAVYFFKSREDADAFSFSDTHRRVTVCGNDIADYKIVVSDVMADKLSEYANRIRKQIKLVTGADLPVVTDAVPECELEILVGRTNRAASAYIPECAAEADDPEEFFNYGWIGITGGKIVLGSKIAPIINEVSELFCRVYLFKGTNMPCDVDIKPTDEICGKSDRFKWLKKWIQPEKSDTADIFREDFASDDGYFTEDNGERSFTVSDGVLCTAPEGFAATYLHIYEKNVTAKADFTFDSGENGGFGLMTRVNSEHAYVKAGYDFDKEEWYVENRDGWDFYPKRTGNSPAKVIPGEVYTLELNVDFYEASLTVNGERVIERVPVTHVSPGRIGIFSDGTSLCVRGFELHNFSKMGKLFKNTYHAKLAYDNYLEGGTVLRMSDGKYVYNHQVGISFLSDNALTWTRGEHPITHTGYINIFRIASGELMKICGERDGSIYSYTSADDGATWARGGKICDIYYKGTTACACNMNDKITQSGTTGRIFYGQNYETPGDKPVEGRYVFCEFYYSDDNGATWCKSETDSWELEGFESLEKNFHFGECKLIECADGDIRVYCSWNWSGYICYADSHDGGKTFGKLMYMEDFEIPHSSMQLVRDIYSDCRTEYYMLYITHSNSKIRGVLNIAHSTDGKSWEKLGEIWHWDTTYYNYGAPINHVIDPFITTTEELIICGAGCSDHMKKENEGGGTYHQAQRQHIWTMKKKSFLGEA